MIKELLPIGSIVKLKNDNRHILIINTGFDNENTYLGVDSEIGFNTDDTIIKFNENEIESVYFTGYLDKEINKSLFEKSMKNIKDE